MLKSQLQNSISSVRPKISLPFALRTITSQSNVESKFIDKPGLFVSPSNSKAYRNILVVVKQTPYQHYLQLKAQGKAPIALRWERLKNRDEVHTRCVESVKSILDKLGLQYHAVRRDELHRGLLVGKDLVIAVGGDGTVLNTSSFIDDTIPLLGVNSDPTRPEEEGAMKPKDERRSRGALCAVTATTIDEALPTIIHGEVSPGLRSRIQCLVRSSYTETRLPPALNDMLIAHPSPASVSRFRLVLSRENVAPTYTIEKPSDELYSMNVWSSGIWVSTATGSTAAMAAAGGKIMDIRSSQLQYRVREHLVEEGPRSDFEKQSGSGMIRDSEMLYIRWNSQVGCIYVDGAHTMHNLELGDEIKIDGHAPYLQLFDPV